MKTILVATIATLFLSIAWGQNQTGNVIDGTWAGQRDKSPVTLKLTAKGNSLTGTYTYQVGIPEFLRESKGPSVATMSAEIMEGKIKGSSIEFKCEFTNGDRSFVGTFTGVVKGNELTLTPDNDKKAQFTLRRSTGNAK